MEQQKEKVTTPSSLCCTWSVETGLCHKTQCNYDGAFGGWPEATPYFDKNQALKK